VIIQCPHCNCCFNEEEATRYNTKNIFTNPKRRPDTWEYLALIDEEKEESL